MLDLGLSKFQVYLGKSDDYYTTPPDYVFDDIKRNSIKIWETYDDEFGYATEKIESIANVSNVRDNAWYIVAKFDNDNQVKLWDMLSDETREYIQSIRGDE